MNAVNKKSKQIALGGIITLFSVVSLYFSSLVPTNRLFFLALSSFFIAIIVIEYGKMKAIPVYVSSSILSLIIVPNKAIVLSYIIFFGYYAIAKSLIERINRLLAEWIIKLLTFNIAMFVVYLVTSKLFFNTITSELPLWILFLAMELIFIIYDYCFSLAIRFYITKIKKKISLKK